MSRETLVDKLEQSSNAFCVKLCYYAKFQFWFSLSSDLPLSAFEKKVTATFSCFNSNPKFLSFCSDKSVIATTPSSLNSGKSINDSILNKVGESLCGVGAVSTCRRYDVATYR